LCYFANKLLNDQAEAEDIVSESFIKLLNTTLKAIHPAELRSFLFAVTRNSCFDFLRKQKRINKQINQSPVIDEIDTCILENEMIFAQVLQIVYEEIENLPEQCRHVFKGIYFEGKSTADLATELSINRQTVLNHKSRAVQLLKFSILKKGIPELIFILILIFLKN
jgi:RNA polymerase sigma factor (sigma-70 family)